MQINFLIAALAALVPLFLGFIWYNPKVFGGVWMQAAGIFPDKAKDMNMVLLLVLSYVFAFLIALSMNFLVIHQTHFYSILVAEPGFGDPNSSVGIMVKDFMAKYGQNYRTFKHGALHGCISALLLITPVISTNAIYEGKGFKYIAVNAGYWILSFMIMGGIISALA